MSHSSANMLKGFMLAATLLFLPISAHAATPPAPVTLTYQVYAGGIHVVQADLSLSVKPASYTAKLTSFTRGFLGALVPWKGSFESTGAHKKNGAYQVSRHKSVSTWKGSDDIAVYDYDASGNFKKLQMTADGKDKTPKTIDPALTRGTTDILTATLNVMQQAVKTGKCDGSADIFDSRRRFTLKYADQGPDTLKKTSYSFYAGPAMKCTAEVIPGAGNWHKKPRGWLSIQEQGRKKGTMPTLWMAKINPDLPAVPVRIMIKTDYGTLFMHLSNALDSKGQSVYKP